MTTMLTPLQRAQKLVRKGSPAPAPMRRDFVIGSGGLRRQDIPETMRLSDVANTFPKAPATDTPPPEKTRKEKREKEKREKTRQGFLDKPITLRRAWAWKAAVASPFVLLLGTAMADKYTGGEVMLRAVDASVAASDYAYKNFHGKINVREAIEWGVKTARAFEVFHTDPNGLLAKNEAAIMAKKRYSGSEFKIKETVLPVIFTVDMERFLGNYALRNAIALRNYPDMKTQERGKILALGFMEDVHKSYDAASELKDIPLKDNDILTYFERRPDIVQKMPVDLQTGLKDMIREMRAAESKLAGQSGRKQGPLVLEDWQKQILEEGLEAEGIRAPTPEEQRRMDEEMNRIIAEQERASRPRTLGEMIEEQKRKNHMPQPSPFI